MKRNNPAPKDIPHTLTFKPQQYLAKWPRFDFALGSVSAQEPEEVTQMFCATVSK